MKQHCLDDITLCHCRSVLKSARVNYQKCWLTISETVSIQAQPGRKQINNDMPALQINKPHAGSEKRTIPMRADVNTTSISTFIATLRAPTMPPMVMLHGNIRVIKAFLVCLAVNALLAYVPPCEAEYFSSVDSLQKLGEIELGLLAMFRKYLNMQQQELAISRKFIERVKAEHSLALNDTEEYLRQPINAFTLTKRLVSDWNQLRAIVKQNKARSVLQQTLLEFTSRPEFPDNKELGGTIIGLARLQKVYDLKAVDLARGNINGVNYGSTLVWHECFVIGATLSDLKEHSLAIVWFEVTLDKLRAEHNQVVRQKFEIDALEYLALANHELGFFDKAIAYMDSILKVKPYHSVRHTKDYILHSPRKQPQYGLIWSWYTNYTSLCQGRQQPEVVPQRLSCRLDAKDNPFFLLAPLKVEEIILDPEVTLYHGLLNDQQIENILQEGATNMQRSSVTSGSESVVLDSRVCQQTWLSYNSPTMRAVHRMVSEITGLDMKNSEEMQLANYGIGGLYEPHHDFFDDGKPGTRWKGDRIITNMFYLSDVEQGGYTVFPYLNVYLRPVKGALVNWYNLHRSLDPDFRTLHAGCPVVKGSKRIGNIWIHSGMQELRRPCGLIRDNFS